MFRGKRESDIFFILTLFLLFVAVSRQEALKIQGHMAIKLETDWRSIIYRGFESEELDYKAAQNWLKLSRQGKAKFARHCMALANTNGGYIVVGVGEDKSGRPCVYTGLTEQQTKSFDPTDVGNFINRFADPALDFDIEKPLLDGRRYVVFVLRRFSLIPHICCASCESELQQGFFYIRTADAASRPAYKASEVHELIQRALRNQREHLGRMLRGILYENRKSLEPEAKLQLTEQLESSRAFFKKLSGEHKWSNGTNWEISVFPSEFIQEKFSLSEIQDCAEKSFANPIGSPFFDPDNSDESYFTNLSLRILSKNLFAFVQIFSSGLFYYQRIFPSNGGGFEYSQLLRFVIDSMLFVGKFYYELGYTDELFSLMFKGTNMENKILLPSLDVETERKKSQRTFVCRIPDIQVRMQRSAADLMSGTSEHSSRIFKEICERFNFPQGQHGQLDDIVANYIKKGAF